MQLSDFDFHLDPERIAFFPSEKRTESRLLHLQPREDITICDQRFYEVLELLEAGDLLVFNDTKVIPARLRGHKTTGGKVEVFIERVLDQRRILAQIHASKAPKINDVLIFSSDIDLRITQRHHKFYELMYAGEKESILEVIEQIGEIPLPPYIKRQVAASDQERYQTVYAQHKGSVAAPTAGFHFDHQLLQKIAEKKVNTGYLTLHIGAGTFAPIHAEKIEDHRMHAEFVFVSAQLCEQIRQTKLRNKRVIVVGTTTLRALETAAQTGAIQPYCGETEIFIYPGYRFHDADILITNLHLPRSSLLMLVCAFGGTHKVMTAYQHALANDYRFYSYGDAMWIPRVARVERSSWNPG